MAQIPSSICNICTEKTGGYYCYDCENFLCQECRIVHDKFPPMKEHTIADTHTEGRRVFKPKPVCYTHKKEYVYYCKDCDCLACRECTTSTHNRHTAWEIKDVANDWREKIKGDIDNLKTKVKSIEGLLDKAKSTNLPQIKSDVIGFEEKVKTTDEEFHQIINRITQIYTTMASDFQQLEEQQQRETITNLEKLHDFYTKTCLKIENLMDEKHDVIFIFERSTILNEIDGLEEIPEDVPIKRMDVFDENLYTDSIVDEIRKQFTISTIKNLTTQLESLGANLKATEKENEQMKEVVNKNQKEIGDLHVALKKKQNELDEIKSKAEEAMSRRYVHKCNSCGNEVASAKRMSFMFVPYGLRRTFELKCCDQLMQFIREQK